ncbi:unnamed protein product, partial [Ixodes pacificus]
SSPAPSVPFCGQRPSSSTASASTSDGWPGCGPPSPTPSARNPSHRGAPGSAPAAAASGTRPRSDAHSTGGRLVQRIPERPQATGEPQVPDEAALLDPDPSGVPGTRSREAGLRRRRVSSPLLRRPLQSGLQVA